MLKYSFLPRKRNKATLSNTVSIIVDSFLPTRRQQYLVQNYKQSSTYRTYSNSIPIYLHNRPKSVILHCLDRKANSTKILPESIHDVDIAIGIFELQKSSGSKHKVDFGYGSSDQMPSCTCKDWIRYHMPCKHFFAVFVNRPSWSWNKLPEKYLKSAYLSTDNHALQSYFAPPNLTMDLTSHEDEGFPTQPLPKPVRLCIT